MAGAFRSSKSSRSRWRFVSVTRPGIRFSRAPVSIGCSPSSTSRPGLPTWPQHPAHPSLRPCRSRGRHADPDRVHGVFHPLPGFLSPGRPPADRSADAGGPARSVAGIRGGGRPGGNTAYLIRHASGCSAAGGGRWPLVPGAVLFRRASGAAIGRFTRRKRWNWWDADGSRQRFEPAPQSRRKVSGDNSMRGVILAAGRGSRLNGVASDSPKCLVEAGGITLVERQIRGAATRRDRRDYGRGRLPGRPCPPAPVGTGLPMLRTRSTPRPTACTRCGWHDLCCMRGSWS